MAITNTPTTHLLADLLRELHRAEGEAGVLTPAQARMLADLDEGGLRPADLARLQGTSRQAAGQLLGQMRAQGLVRTSPDPTNRRATLVRPTPRGRRLLERHRVAQRQAEAELASRIGKGNARVLRGLLASAVG